MYPLFIGFASLETWLKAIDIFQPVYAIMATEYGQPGRYDIRTDQFVITVAQPDGDVVHYVRLVAAQIQYQNGEPITNDRKKRMADAEQTWQRVCDWLTDHNLVVKSGLIAAPENLNLLNSLLD